MIEQLKLKVIAYKDRLILKCNVFSGRIKNEDKVLKSIRGDKKLRKSMSSIEREREIYERDNPIGTSLYLFGPQNRFRLFIFNLVKNTYFDYFIILMIFFNAILLAVSNPLLDPKSE